jgi:Type I restriction enzyme R protein N terminus (HSDR_N)
MMAIMGSLSSRRESHNFYDFLRRKWVKATPEEVVRQRLIRWMVEELGFPSHLMAIEKELAQLPHLQNLPLAQIPKRRLDLLVFSPKDLSPLLMIECKATTLSSKSIRQLIGYNYFVKASFICLANHHEVLTGLFCLSEKKYRFQKGMPRFEQLTQVYHL